MYITPIHNVRCPVSIMDLWCMLFLFLLLLTTMQSTAGCPTMCHCPELTNDVVCISKNLTLIPRHVPKTATGLDFTNNVIDRVTRAELAGLRHLVTLNFENNLIQNVQDGAFEDLESLNTLDLSHNRLSIVTEQSLAGITHITTLDLSNNLIQHIDGTFSKMTHLTRIDLSYNQIQRISQVSFRDLRSLRYLMLADNQIGHIDKRAFRTLDQLMYLVLRGNPIHRVVKYEFNSRFLSYVDLSECGLDHIPRGLPATIRYLQLRKNNLTEIHRRSFRDCPHVSILVLDNNGLVNIDDRTFEDMPYLQQLWLNDNKLTHVPHPLPTGLQRLLMDQNRISQLDNVFPPDSQLHTLSLMGNNLTYLSYDALVHLPRLNSLDVSENNLTHLYGHTFLHQANLTFLQLSKNPLTHFHSRSLWGLTNLRTLSLAYIDTMVAFHPDVFGHVTQLRKLNIDSSPRIVRTLFSSGDFIRSIGSSVQDLSIQSCELTWLSSDFPAWFPNLTTLHISSTRWHCDTRLVWLRDWLRSSTDVDIVKPDEIACFTPRKTHGRSIVSLSDGEFVEATEPPRTISTRSPRVLSTFPSIEGTSSNNRRMTSPSSVLSGGIYSTLSTGSTQKTTVSTQSSVSELSHAHTPTTTITPHTYTTNYSIDAHIDFPPPSGGDSTSRRHMTPEEWDRIINPIQPPGKTFTERKPGSSGQSTEQSNLDLSESIAPKNNMKTIIIVVVTVATVVIATVIIVFIVYFLRKQNSPMRPPPAHKEGAYQNGSIKYQHKNNILYFMPNGKAKKSESSSDSVKSSSTTKEQMTLIPGRDINHEGPLRVYKWEDF